MDSIFLQVIKLENAIRLAYNTQLAEFRLGLTEAHALALLDEQGPQRASTLAQGVGYAATSFTPILDRLEALGYIVRRTDPSDRRAINLQLTNEGRALFPRLRLALDAAHTAAVSLFSDPQTSAAKFVARYGSVKQGEPY